MTKRKHPPHKHNRANCDTEREREKKSKNEPTVHDRRWQNEMNHARSDSYQYRGGIGDLTRMLFRRRTQFPQRSAILFSEENASTRLR